MFARGIDKQHRAVWGLENFTQRWTKSKSEHCFQFSKREGEASPLPLVARLCVAEYASKSLNMAKYP